MPPKSANKPATALRQSLPRKCKNAVSKTSSRPQPGSKRDNRRAIATSPALPPSGSEEDNSASPRPEDGWAPWPSHRRLTREEYKQVLDERLRIFHLGLMQFFDHTHMVYIDGQWEDLQIALVAIGHDFVDTVDWDQLDADTQQWLTRWAPKAKEYLETPLGSTVIFKGWLWRVLVDQVFNGPGDHEVWQAHSRFLRMIEPVANYYPPPSDGPPDAEAQRVAARCILWRVLTADLLRVVGKHQARYSVESVEGIIRQALGRWLRPSQKLDVDLRRLARVVSEIDWHMHCSETRWEFHFVDPTTGKQHGYPFKASKDVVLNGYNGNTQDEEGRPVDLITVPLVLAMGDLMRPVGDWALGRFCRECMEVCVDLFPDDDGSDVEVEGQPTV